MGDFNLQNLANPVFAAAGQKETPGQPVILNFELRDGIETNCVWLTDRKSVV